MSAIGLLASSWTAVATAKLLMIGKEGEQQSRQWMRRLGGERKRGRGQREQTTATQSQRAADKVSTAGAKLGSRLPPLGEPISAP